MSLVLRCSLIHMQSDLLVNCKIFYNWMKIYFPHKTGCTCFIGTKHLSFCFLLHHPLSLNAGLPLYLSTCFHNCLLVNSQQQTIKTNLGGSNTFCSLLSQTLASSTSNPRRWQEPWEQNIFVFTFTQTSFLIKPQLRVLPRKVMRNRA